MSTGASRQDLSKMEANLGSQKLIFEAQLGLYLGEGLGGHEAPQNIFEAQEPPQNPLKNVRSLKLTLH